MSVITFEVLFILGTDKHASSPEAFAASVQEKVLPSDCKLRRVKYLNLAELLIGTNSVSKQTLQRDRRTFRPP